MSDMKDRLAKAREAKAKREKAEKDAAEARELEVLELEEKLEKEHGPRGKFFEIVETLDGPVAVKLGESVLHTRFQAAKEITDSALHDYVYPCVVHPSKEKYLEMVGQRPAIALRCANALATLFGMKKGDDESKF